MTMPSSNPAFRGLSGAGNGQQQYAGWGAAPQPQYGAPAQYDPYAAPSPYSATTTRYLTMDDVIVKTGITFLVTVLAAAATWTIVPDAMAIALLIPALIVGLVLGLVIAFKQIANPAATLAYAAVEGVLVGAISEFYAANWGGNIVMQAVIGTFGVFFGMLVVYKTGAIRVTPKFTRWIVGAMFGALALVLVNLVVGLFTGSAGPLRDGGPLAIVFSLVMIGIAAFSFLLDFDQADQAIRAGAPEKAAWGIALGLTVTLVWLYLEILRLLSYFNSD